MGKTYSVSIILTTFTDYRQYLAAVMAELKQQGLFSHRGFNADCGFTSPNFLQLVVQGKRGLSEEAAVRVGKVLSLSPEQMRIFLKMLRMNHATTTEEKVDRLQDLLKETAYRQHHQLSEDQLEFYRRWYHIPLRELLVSFPHAEPAELGARLRPCISEAEVVEALELMSRLRLIEKVDDRWMVLHEALSTGNEIRHQLLRYFHKQMMDLAKESLDHFPAALREISAVTLRLKPDDLARLKEKIREFKREVLAFESAAEGTPVVQFNFQMFPVSQGFGEEEP